MKDVFITCCGLITVLSSLSVIVGYLANIPRLTTWATGDTTPMARSTALTFFAVGTAITIIGLERIWTKLRQ
jgi:hypothetical protein